MKKLWRREVGHLLAMCAVASFVLGFQCLPAKGQARQTDAVLIAQRDATEKELESIAIIERKVMVPMRDGKRMQADIYRPKDESKKYPIIFVRTPYNFNYWDIDLGAPRDMKSVLDAVKRGYAYVEMNERGRYFSEGDYDILGPPLTDSDDELDWMSSQPWSNGKVGLIGCSSTAEWQLAVASRGNKALGDVHALGFGAGVGRVGSVLRAGQLVSRRRSADAVHDVVARLRISDRRASHVSRRNPAAGADHRGQIVRPESARTARRLVEGSLASAGKRHSEGCWRRQWHLRQTLLPA